MPITDEIEGMINKVDLISVDVIAAAAAIAVVAEKASTAVSALTSEIESAIEKFKDQHEEADLARMSEAVEKMKASVEKMNITVAEHLSEEPAVTETS